MFENIKQDYPDKGTQVVEVTGSSFQFEYFVTIGHDYNIVEWSKEKISNRQLQIIFKRTHCTAKNYCIQWILCIAICE